MAKSTAGLVPISRAFLAKFYEGYPFDPLADDIAKLHERLVSQSEPLNAQHKTSKGESEGIVEAEVFDPPHKLDENFWKNREQLEEIVYLLDEKHWPEALKAGDSPSLQALKDAIPKWYSVCDQLINVIANYQKETSEKVSNMVFTYMPQDFRGTLLKQQKDRSERRRQLEVDTLVNSGGSIKQKYALLWQQQMDRRKSLASLGSATGIYRTLVTYLVGVPQVLLDFVKTVNDHDGPMEEQRLRYGPHLYALTKFVTYLHIFLALWWSCFDSTVTDVSDHVGLVSDALTVYTKEITRFLETLKLIFENSPFLISAEDALSAEDKSKAEEFKEATISFGSTHQVPISVEEAGTLVAWEFKLTSGKDIGFSVDFCPEDGAKTGMVPYKKEESDQGSFNAPAAGNYIVTWDNSYSYLTRKVIRYKVGAIPPVETEQQVEAEEALAHAADEGAGGTETTEA